MKDNSRASIREVYKIAERLEDKIDKVDQRICNMEGKVSIIAIVWSSVVSILGIIIGLYRK